MKNGILKRLKFLIDFGNFQKQNLQFDDRLKKAEEKMQSIQTESKARFQTSNEFHFRWLKMIHYRDRDESSNPHLDSLTKILQTIQNDSKTIHSPSFKQSIERKLDKTEIYASEEIVQSYFG